MTENATTGPLCLLLLTYGEVHGACNFQSTSWSPAPRMHDLNNFIRHKTSLKIEQSRVTRAVKKVKNIVSNFSDPMRCLIFIGCHAQIPLPTVICSGKLQRKTDLCQAQRVQFLICVCSFAIVCYLWKAVLFPSQKGSWGGSKDFNNAKTGMKILFAELYPPLSE